MNTNDPIIQALTARGSPFELVERGGTQHFANAPRSLDQLIEGAKRHGEKTFLIEGERRLTFDDSFALRDALASELSIEPGERVAICMRNRIEWIIAFMAVTRAGGVPVLVNSRSSASELVRAINDIECELVLADNQRAEFLRDGSFRGRIIDADDFPAKGAAFEPPSPPSPDDPAAILFTSGTSGTVKGAVLSHTNIASGIMTMQMAGLMVLHNMAKRFGVPVEQLLAGIGQQAVLLVYPLFHISGLGSAFLSPLVAGSKIVILPRWDAAEAARAIAAEKVTMFSAVPTMLRDILKYAEVAETDLSSLRNIGTGGQALPINLLDQIRQVCPDAVLGTGYGLTETAGSVSMAVGEDFLRKRSAAGRVMPNVEMRITAPDGRELPDGEAGEIVVRGPQVASRYWDGTRAIDEDGWFRTGDIGYLDEERYLFVVDRLKDMVISGGENIYCAEVERVLSEMSGISECATFGIADERMGEALVAVVKAPDLDERAIIQHVETRLARYKVPTRVAFIDAPLPRNDLDKVDKIRLREMWPQLAEKNP